MHDGVFSHVARNPDGVRMFGAIQRNQCAVDHAVPECAIASAQSHQVIAGRPRTHHFFNQGDPLFRMGPHIEVQHALSQYFFAQVATDGLKT